ncbi:hypothetical protein NLX83_38295 [Allokutzneria sp. A3M-2-11 16]|uniref:hypothetical protein n=1 Tax=Allokutzneria sp. A3M-2-11 16 TaxID=2962043 RepID=UPI0020B6C80F|nr:hypothetical protein [Allokutzneria sp. A3M-2-11 16]MCP3805132.1 hypothetical protein [Allokutzneria sp. A3M-2-11 16]
MAVWSDERAVQGFIRLPAHVAIMRKHRRRGVTRVTRWWTTVHDQADIWPEARRWLTAAVRSP